MYGSRRVYPAGHLARLREDDSAKKGEAAMLSPFFCQSIVYDTRSSRFVVAINGLTTLYCPPNILS